MDVDVNEMWPGFPHLKQIVWLETGVALEQFY